VSLREEKVKCCRFVLKFGGVPYHCEFMTHHPWSVDRTCIPMVCVVSVDELAVDRHLYGSVRMFMKSRSLFSRSCLLEDM